MNDETESRVRSVKLYVEENSEKITVMVDTLVSKYNQDLDDFINTVKENIVRKEKLTIFEIENMCLKIPIFMYFSTSGVENIGIQMDNAKSVKDTRYNNEYMDAKGTVGDKTAEAENEIIPEALTLIIYQRAYKKLKQKLDVCEILCRSANKVLQSRISDLDITKNGVNYTQESRMKNKEE